MRCRGADVDLCAVVDADVALGMQRRAVHVHLQMHTFPDEDVAGADPVAEVLVRNVCLQVCCNLDVGVGVDLIAAAFDGQLPIALDDDQRTVGLISAREERVERHAAAVVVRIKVGVVEGAVAFEGEMIFALVRIPPDEIQAHAWRGHMVECHVGVVEVEVFECQMGAVRIECDGAPAKPGCCQVERLARLHRVVADIQNALILGFIGDGERGFFGRVGLALLICDLALDDSRHIVLHRGRDDERVRRCGCAVQHEDVAAVAVGPLVACHFFRLLDFHMEGRAVRIGDLRTLRLLLDDQRARFRLRVCLRARVRVVRPRHPRHRDQHH